jgi:tetratricopeptide (TPR) repeat protein
MAVLYRPTHVAAWSNTLVLLDSMRDYEKVLELGTTALIHNPKSPALHFSIANTLGKVQQFEKAEGHFLEAINLNPGNALYHSNLGKYSS